MKIRDLAAPMGSNEPLETPVGSRPTMGGYLVGTYLFSVAAFGFSGSPVLLVIPQIVGAALVGYALFDLLGRFRIAIPAEIGLYGLLGLWAAFTHFISPRAGEGITPGLGTLLKVVIATLACAQLVRTDGDLFTALKMFVFSVLFVYAQNVGEIRYLRMAGQVSEDERFAGTLLNANSAAIFALTIIWAALLLFLRSKKPVSTAAFLSAPIVVSLIMIYYSGSKKGLIGLALFVLFFSRLLYQRHAKTLFRRGLVVLVSSAMIVGAGYFIYTSPFFFRMGSLISGLSNVSDANRWELAREALQVWLMNGKTLLIGVGFDNFWTHSVLQTYAHSTPLELLASTGIVGLSLFLGYLGLLARKFLRLYQWTPDAGSKSIYFAINIMFLIFAFFMVAAVVYDAKEMMPIFGSLAGWGHVQLQQLGRMRPLSPGEEGPAFGGRDEGM